MAKAAPKKSTEELYVWDAEKRGSGLLLCGGGNTGSVQAADRRAE